MRSSLPVIERAKPLLGTYVRIRVQGLAHARAHAAIDAAFSEIAAIHRLMSFQEPTSDITRLNREAHAKPVAVDPRTYEVLTRAAELSALSEGVFDITIAPRLVRAGHLPRPVGCEPDPCASWRDVTLLQDHRVKFERPLWIDVSGIAKGYAVDRAVELLTAFEPAQICVNAGGDLRVTGARAERVRLNAGSQCDADPVPLLEIEDASIASSGGTSRCPSLSLTGVHVDATDLNQIPANRFVSVIARRCIDADACTKIVMALGDEAGAVLRTMHAHGVVHDPSRGWREVA